MELLTLQLIIAISLFIPFGFHYESGEQPGCLDRIIDLIIVFLMLIVGIICFLVVALIFVYWIFKSYLNYFCWLLNVYLIVLEPSRNYTVSNLLHNYNVTVPSKWVEFMWIKFDSPHLLISWGKLLRFWLQVRLWFTHMIRKMSLL